MDGYKLMKNQTDSTTAQLALEACPFCGSEPERSKRMVQREPPKYVPVARCIRRGCPMFCKNVDIESSHYSAIVWNTRAASAAPTVGEFEKEAIALCLSVGISDNDTNVKQAQRYLADLFCGKSPTGIRQTILGTAPAAASLAAPTVDDTTLLESLRKERADQGSFWTFYQADPLMVKAADRIEELLRWHGTEQSMHTAWRKRAEEAETALIAIQKGD